MGSRPAAMKAAYAARLNAAEAEPAATAARGALAVFLHANDYVEAAAAHYDYLRGKDPGNGRWPYYLARIVHDEGQTERARALLDEAATRAPEYALIELRRAELLLKSGESAEAESGFRAYLARVPRSAHAQLGLARIAMQQQDWAGAELRLRAALREEADFPAARALLVSVYEARGETPRAAEARESMSASQRHREPDDPWLDELVDHCFDVEKLSVLADIAMETGRLKRGIELLERSQKIEPNRARTLLDLAKAKLRSEGRAPAVPLLGAAVRLDPLLAEAHYLLVGELASGGDLPGAQSASERGLRHNPENSGLHRQNGTLLQAKGQREAAEAAFQRAVLLDSTEVKNVESLGNFYWSVGRKEQAVAQFERARALSRLAVKPRAILGGYYLEMQRLAEAEQCVAEAYEIEPRMDGLDELRALLKVRQGNAFFRAGDAARAEAAFREALAAKPDHEESLTNLVAVWIRTGRTNDARALLDRFIADQPKATFGYLLAARLSAQAGDRNTAFQLTERGLKVARERRDAGQEQALRSFQDRLRAP